MNEIHCDQDLAIQNKYLATNIVDELCVCVWGGGGGQKSIWPPPRQQSCL